MVVRQGFVPSFVSWIELKIREYTKSSSCTRPFQKKKKFLHKTTVIKLLLWCVRHKLDICAPFMFVFGKRFMEFFVVKCFTSFYIGFSGKQKTFYRFDTFYKETNTWKYRFFFFQKIFYNQTSGLLNISFVWKIDIYFPTN